MDTMNNFEDQMTKLNDIIATIREIKGASYAKSLTILLSTSTLVLPLMVEQCNEDDDLRNTVSHVLSCSVVSMAEIVYTSTDTTDSNKDFSIFLDEYVKNYQGLADLAIGKET